MSQPRKSFKSSLTKEAFQPATECKPVSVEQAVYDKKAKYIGSYTKEDNKAFKEQFNYLLDLLARWGVEQKCSSSNVVSGIQKLKSDFFLPEFSGMQSANYFETIKLYLEKIYLALQDQAIPLSKRRNEYSKLCANFVTCGPGIYTHVESIWLTLNPEISVSRWLADLRTQLIEIYANQYIKKNNISSGNSIHVINAFSSYAHDQKWEPVYSAGKIRDAFTSHANIKAENLIDFHRYFENEYNPTAIRACLENNIQLELKMIFSSFSYGLTSWNIIGVDYYKFIEKISVLFDKLELPFKADEYFELHDDCTMFRMNMKNIIDKLCARYLQPVLYFDVSNNEYVHLVPLSWLGNTCSAETLDKKVWDRVPKEEFPQVLANTINAISYENISNLLWGFPAHQLCELRKEQKQYDNFLATITDSAKRTLAKETIARRTMVIKEMDVKVSSSNIYHDMSRSTYDVLLKIAKGQQEQAETIFVKYPELLLKKSVVMDYSNRLFEPLTPFQYALWALDRHMWEMILKYLPTDKAAEQLKELEDNGVAYISSKGKSIREKHYDFSPLIDALQDLVDHDDNDNAKRWTVNVGGAQKDIPVHVANEYCRPDRSFFPTPSFKEKSLDRMLTYYNFQKREYLSWFLDSDLGVKEAIGRGNKIMYPLSDYIRLPQACKSDLAAMKALQNVRMQEYNSLKDKLLMPAPTAGMSLK